MSTTALALVLTAALAHALWNLAAKRVASDAVVFVWMYVVGSVVLCGPTTLVWMATTDVVPDGRWVLGAAVSAVLHAVYSVVLQHGYAVGELNLVYPLARGTGPLVTMVVAIAFLGDRPAPVAIIGGLLIVGGIAVISNGGPAATPPGRRRAGIRWGIATGVTIASYTLWDSHAVTALEVPPLPYFTLSLLFQVPVLTAAAWSRRDAGRTIARGHWREIAAVSVLSPLAYILVLEAMRLAPVALVAPARETSIVVGSLLGWLVLKEPDPRRRLLGSAVVLAGIAALVSG
ncbi:MAG: DMT family transporter [Nocardioidaceae bacterium]